MGWIMVMRTGSLAYFGLSFCVLSIITLPPPMPSNYIVYKTLLEKPIFVSITER